MNYKWLKQLLMLLVVFLVCSITPAAAIQNTNIQSSDDWVALFNETYMEDMTKLLNSFDEASNTELTPEQDTYLEQHEPVLLSKAEIILYNLQQFLNFLLAEYYITNTTTHSNERSDDNNLETLKSLDKYNCTELLCTLQELSEGKCRDPKKPNEIIKIQQPFNMSNVIIHGKDRDYGCMESVKVNILNGAEIKYQKGKINETRTHVEFINEFKPTINNTLYSITVFHDEYSTQDALKFIYTKKSIALSNKKDRLDNYKIICTIFAGSAGVAVAVAGAYRLCDYCSSQTRQRITEIMTHPEEAVPLVQPNGLVKTYTRITEEVHNNQYCNKCTVGVGIVTCGTLILIGSVIGFIICNEESIRCKNKLECLKNYDPR